MHYLSNDDQCTCKFIYVTTFKNTCCIPSCAGYTFFGGSIDSSSSYRHPADPLFFQKVDIVHPDGVTRYPERSTVTKTTHCLLQYSKRWPAARPLHGYFQTDKTGGLFGHCDAFLENTVKQLGTSVLKINNSNSIKSVREYVRGAYRWASKSVQMNQEKFCSVCRKSFGCTISTTPHLDHYGLLQT